MKIISLPYTHSEGIKYVFNSLAKFQYSIWLDSGDSAKYQQRFDIITAFPDKTITSDLDKTTIAEIKYDHSLNISNKNTYDIEHSATQTPFDIVNDIIQDLNLTTVLNEHDTKDIPFWHGLAGYFGYDLNQLITNKLAQQKCTRNIPIMALGLYSWALIFDHKKHEAYIAYKTANISETKINTIVNLLFKSLNNINDLLNYNNQKKQSNLYTFFSEHNFIPQVDYQRYQKGFNKIKNHIKHGDCYQINYTIPFKLDINNLHKTTSDIISSWQIYNYLKKFNKNPFGCYFNISSNLAIMSFSPERFIEHNQSIVKTMPIKGTRPHIVDNIEQNQIEISSLTNSPKDRAENIMITDLMRNDLNKHCEAGSVITEKVCELQTFPTVHHLVSTINGKLKSNLNSVDLLKGCFPGGSITGTPKIRAMQIIQEIENHDDQISRYVYCGCIGYINVNYNMDTNIAIRTAVYTNDEITYWAGGGIVADSECEKEYQEILDKLIKTH